MPYYGATGQVGTIDTHLFDEELVLLGEDAAPFLDLDKDKAYIVRGKSWVNNHAHVLRARPCLLNKFLLHQLNVADFRPFVSGSTRLKLPQGSMAEMPIVVAPLHEQERVVAAIEEHLSELSKAGSNLERARRNLIRYRSCMLVTACSGGLVQVDPSRWKTAPLAAVVSSTLIGLDRGRPQQRPQPPGSPYVKMNLVTSDGRVIREGFPWVDVSQQERIRFGLVDGDLLFNTRNSRELVGKTGLVAALPTGSVFNNNLMRIRCNEAMLPRFLVLVMQSPNWLRKLELIKKGTTNVAAIYANDLLRLEVPVPPIEDQDRIASEVERHVVLTEALVASLRQAEARARRLRRSLIVSAFAGKLVSQNPADEPAAELLARMPSVRSAFTSVNGHESPTPVHEVNSMRKSRGRPRGSKNRKTT